MAPSLLPIPGTAELGTAGRIVAEEVAPDDIAGTPDSVTIAADSLGSLVVDGVQARETGCVRWAWTGAASCRTC